MNRRLFFIITILGLEACNNNSAIKVSRIQGNEFISCNIDKIKETHSLKLSEVAESCETVFLEKDSLLSDEDYDLKQVTVSDNFIVAMPDDKPALLYSREGKFIKRLGGAGNQEYYCAMHAQIDKLEDKVYIQVPGFEQLYCFGLKDSSFRRIDWAVKQTYSFVFVNSTTMYGEITQDKGHWGYFQPINTSIAKLIPARYPNLLHPYFSVSYKLLFEGDKIVLDFSDDSTYYFNPVTRSYTPFLYCYSEKNKIDPRRILENIAKYGVDYEKISEGIPYQYKHLQIAANGYYVFRVYNQELGDDYFLAIHKKEQTAFRVDSLINDFLGNHKIETKKAMTSYYFYYTNDGYLTLLYSLPEMKEEIGKLNLNALDQATKDKIIQMTDKLKDDKTYSTVLFH